MVTRDRAGLILLEMVTSHRVFRVAGQRQSRSSISGTKAGVLQFLKSKDARLGEVSRELGVSASVASRAVDALETMGLVRRAPDANDARALVISITDQGRADLARRHHYIAAKFAQVLPDWTEAETDDAIALLRQLNLHLNELTEALEADDRRELTA